MYAHPKCDCRMACGTPSGRWRRKTSFSIWGRNVSFATSLLLAGRRPRTSPYVYVHPTRDLRASAVLYSVNWRFVNQRFGTVSVPSSRASQSFHMRCVTSQKSARIIYIAAEAWNPPRKMPSRRVEVFFLTSALDGSRLLKPHLVRLTSGAHSTGGWWAPWPIWTGAENFAPAGMWYKDLSTRSELLYRLSYPGPCLTVRR